MNDLKFTTPLNGQEGDYVAIRLEGAPRHAPARAGSASPNARTWRLLVARPAPPVSTGFQTAVSGRGYSCSGAPTARLVGLARPAGTRTPGFCIQTTTANDIVDRDHLDDPARFWQMSQIVPEHVGGRAAAADLAVRVINDIIAELQHGDHAAAA